MSTHNKYNKMIEDIINFKGDCYIITQKKAKKVMNGEIPKSMFDDNYIKNGKNELARFINYNNYRFEIIEPQIIIYKS